MNVEIDTILFLLNKYRKENGLMALSKKELLTIVSNDAGLILNMDYRGKEMLHHQDADQLMSRITKGSEKLLKEELNNRLITPSGYRRLNLIMIGVMIATVALHLYTM